MSTPSRRSPQLPFFKGLGIYRAGSRQRRLTLTLGDALSRADTEALFDMTEWPDYDRASVLAVNKVLNEDDVLPIQLTRRVAQDARLLPAAKGQLLVTKLATALIEASGTSSKIANSLPGDPFQEGHQVAGQ